MSNDTQTKRTEEGASLARGSALIFGTILVVAGLYFIYKQHMFPKFTQFPAGEVPATDQVFFGPPEDPRKQTTRTRSTVG